MNPVRLSQLLASSVMALGLVVTPVVSPASAQSNTAPNEPNTSTLGENNRPNLDTTPLQETRGQHDNFGWLGLLGLIGLVNLLRKPKEPELYRDPNVPGEARQPGSRL